MSRLRARGLGTGLGAFAFLHQMAKPPMSLDEEGQGRRVLTQGIARVENSCQEKKGGTRLLGDPSLLGNFPFSISAHILSNCWVPSLYYINFRHTNSFILHDDPTRLVQLSVLTCEN